MMNRKVVYSLALTLALQNTAAQAGVYSFGGSCPTQGSWTQMALQQSASIAAAIEQIKNNPDCKGIDMVAKDLESAQYQLSAGPDTSQQQDRMETIPAEMTALKSGIMAGGKINEGASSLLVQRTMEAARISSKIRATPVSSNSPPTNIDIGAIFAKFSEPARKGLDLATRVMETLPQYDRCLMGHPQQGMMILSGAVKVAAAFSSAGNGIGESLGNAISAFSNMVREQQFTKVLSKLDETEFWNSISCLLESTAKNYCDTDNAEDMREYFLRERNRQYADAAKQNALKQSDPNYDNPLEGYYVLARELPLISNWIQQVQFGTTPKLSTDATFKNTVWQNVTDLTKSINTMSGQFNEDLSVMKEQPDLTSKKNQLKKALTNVTNAMVGDFFTNTVNSDLLPFYLIGLDTIPPECVQSRDNPMKQAWDDWMTRSNGGTFIKAFDDPEKLALTIQTRMQNVIDSATLKASAFFRKRLVLDNQDLVNQTLTGSNLTVRKAFKNIADYLTRFENRLNKDDDSLDLILLSTVIETKGKIAKFLASYDDLRKVGKKLAKATDKEERASYIAQSKVAANKVISTLFDEFDLLYERDTYLNNRLSTIIDYDFSARIKKKENMDSHQQDILAIAQKHLLEKMISLNGMNVDIDLSTAQVINKRNLDIMEEAFKRPMYRIILDMKAVADGKAISEVQKQLDRKYEMEKKAAMNRAYTMPNGIASMGASLTSWLFGGMMIKNNNSDFYRVNNDPNAVHGRDDRHGSWAQVQAKFCAQTLSFEDIGFYREICQGTKLNGRGNSPALDLRYDDYLPKGISARAIQNDKIKKGKNVCAFNDYQMRNLVQWLKDKDDEARDENY